MAHLENGFHPPIQKSLPMASSTTKKILKCTGYLVGILIVLRLGYPLCFPVYQVTTDSMKPTIERGKYIIASKFHYTFFDPARNDIAVFKPIKNIFESGTWTHRIIAVAGDTVVIKNGLITINGSPALFPQINHEDAEVRVFEGYVFQKGDNKETIAGLVPEKEILGKVIFNFSK